MASINRYTGKPLSGFDEVVQAIEVIFTTRVASRVMRRWFGSIGPSLLGRLMVPNTLMLFMAVLITAIELWEPRFKVRRILPAGNSAEALRQGEFTLVIEGEYRPKAHLGDPTPVGGRRISLSTSSLGFSFKNL